MSSVNEAWNQYENNNYYASLKLWDDLIEGSEENQEALIGKVYSLIAIKFFSEARRITLELFHKTNSHVFLHQMIMIERESQNFDTAIQYVQKERALIAKDNKLALAANYYEEGTVKYLNSNIEGAVNAASKSHTLAVKSGDLIMQACANRLLGDIKVMDHDRGAARSFYNKALQFFTEAGEEFGKLEVEELLLKVSDD